MSSPLYGPVPIKDRKSMTGPLAGSVRLKKLARELKVVPLATPAGRKKTPFRKMLKELKHENRSKFEPTVSECRPRNSVRLSVNCQTSWSRMLWIENGSWPTVV